MGAEIVLAFHHQTVLVLLGQLARGADHLVDQRRQHHRFRIELELAGLDLGEIEHLIDQAEQMGAGAMHAAERLLRLLGAEPRVALVTIISVKPDDGVERRAQLVAHAGEELRLVPAERFELLVEPPELLAHPVHVVRQVRPARRG